MDCKTQGKYSRSGDPDRTISDGMVEVAAAARIRMELDGAAEAKAGAGGEPRLRREQRRGRTGRTVHPEVAAVNGVDCWRNGGPSRPCLPGGRPEEETRAAEERSHGTREAPRAEPGSGRQAGKQTARQGALCAEQLPSRRRTERGLDVNLVGVGIGIFVAADERHACRTE
ncbi:hypothetical protein WMY93_014299 [Mugilogobius chulae]|uniref:Uncharacterized protein n=1 Tax=Mugilogobius chulae TaxID=88201 RepID=A0AAW0NYC6_9GOBI